MSLRSLAALAGKRENLNLYVSPLTRFLRLREEATKERYTIVVGGCCFLDSQDYTAFYGRKYFKVR